MWGYNNTRIDLIELNGKVHIKDISNLQNNGLKLGDTGSDIIRVGDSILVTISNSQSIEVFDINNFKSLGRIIFENNSFPRSIAVKDTLLFVSLLYSGGVAVYNLNNGNKLKEIATGPYPESIVLLDNKLFVANSGFGDIAQNQAGSGTLSIIDIDNLTLINSYYIGPNLTDIAIDTLSSRIFCAYLHLPSLEGDSLGGIAEFDLITNKVTNIFRTAIAQNTLKIKNEKIFYISNRGVESVTFNFNETNLLIDNKMNDRWYSLNVDNDFIYIGNAKNHVRNGTVEIYSHNGNTISKLKEIETGINPRKIILFE